MTTPTSHTPREWAERLPPCEALQVRRFPHGEILLVRRPGRRLQLFVSPERLDVNDVRPGELLAALVLLVVGMAIAVAMWWVLAADLVLTLGGMALLAGITIVCLYFVERSARSRARLQPGELVIPRIGRSRSVPLDRVDGYEIDGDRLLVRVTGDGAGDERVELVSLEDPEQRALAHALLGAATLQMREHGRLDPATLDACEPG